MSLRACIQSALGAWEERGTDLLDHDMSGDAHERGSGNANENCGESEEGGEQGGGGAKGLGHGRVLQSGTDCDLKIAHPGN